MKQIFKVNGYDLISFMEVLYTKVKEEKLTQVIKIKYFLANIIIIITKENNEAFE
ncbi:MAG: Unknown protein [uncultured Sulfurovum sp.]|uniref:Uncharacterized protein n=1 Tax=uncultured Sulfurovum sp. TaxID=269237 RepID=A0A6S6S373_9BACT|nr:MAG: Unknown protein [uncultured Sulfurovum sp.]